MFLVVVEANGDQHVPYEADGDLHVVILIGTGEDLHVLCCG